MHKSFYYIVVCQCTMHPNQITRRELFSNNLSDRNEYTDGHESFSQLQNSNSQYNDMMTQSSQDAVNSQQFSSGSESHDRRRFWDKYMSGNVTVNQSKGYRNINQKSVKSDYHLNHTGSSKSNFQQHLQMNKARASERDERDLLSSVVKTVKECSADMKHTLEDIHDTIGRSANSTEDKLSGIIISMTEEIQQKYDKMINVVKEREENRHKYHQVENELKQKEEKIIELQQKVTQLEEIGFKNVIDSMKEIVDQHQSITKERLDRLLEITTKQLDSQKEIIHQQREGYEQQQEFEIHMKDMTQKHGSNDKCVLDELLTLRQELARHKTELENFCRDKVYSSLKQTDDLKKFIQSGLEDNAHMSFNQSKQLFNQNWYQLKEVVTTQNDQLKTLIDNRLSEGRAEPFEKNKPEKSFWHGKSRSKFSDYHESVPQKIQEKLDEMHSNHIKEIERIRKEINERNEEHYMKTASCVPSKMQQSHLAEVQEMNNDQNGLPGSVSFKTGKRSTFISPALLRPVGWTTGQLFNKTNPSPVATVHPQQKEETSQKSNEEVMKQSVNEQSQSKPKPKRNVQPQQKYKNLSETEEDYPNEMIPANQCNEQRRSQRLLRQRSGFQGDRNISATNISNNYLNVEINPPPTKVPRQATSQEQKHDNQVSRQWSREQTFTSRNTSYSSNQYRADVSQREGIFKKTPKRSDCQTINMELKSNMNTSHPPQSHAILQSKASVYDFTNEVLPTMHQQNTQLSRKMKKKAANYDSESSSSRDSSPSVSVTKIVIQRKVKRDHMKYPQKDSAPRKATQVQHKEYDDFLSILGSVGDPSEKQLYRRETKRPITDYGVETTYSPVAESAHKKRKYKHI